MRKKALICCLWSDLQHVDLYGRKQCFESCHFFSMGGKEREKKKKSLFYNFFLMEYSWSIKFQFHFEMRPGRMCRKCQHIQQHELKMISACNGVLLPVSSTSSIF